MKVHVLQHASFEGLGNMETWLRERGAEIHFSHLYRSDALPGIDELDNIDLLVALGGPMSVNDEAALPWLVPEKRLIAAAIERRNAVLGICLGAQLIAASQGARVYPAAHREIGWHAITGTSKHDATFRFPGQAEVFHWHGETFDLPAGAVNLARSETCVNQAFQLGARVIGLQFHLEVTAASVAGMLEHGAGELTTGDYVQSEGRIRAQHESSYTKLQTWMVSVLDHLMTSADAAVAPPLRSLPLER